MTDNITLIGFVATPPRHTVTGEGLPITSFRLASTHRRFDRAQGRWADGETNWFTITTFRQLAVNAAGSVNKGDRVIVSGRLRIRGWEVGDRSGTTIEVEADAVGHDLSWGTTAFSRTIVSAPVRDGSTKAAEADAGAATGSTEGDFPTREALEAEDSQQAADADSVAAPF
ncbi:single-stranded DNA-binding protein [Parafrigoribacterium soli]|uniref:single-stranded DNA-binding protein n=1 Tax=Parafrigoribacterium soli TaxID=3144663 RepID=UPI0032EF70BD